MSVGLIHASPSLLPISPLIAEATVCVLPIESFMAHWVSNSKFRLKRMLHILSLVHVIRIETFVLQFCLNF